MKTFLPCLILFSISCLGLVRASETDPIAAVRAADDERVSAVIAGDASRLKAIISDQLHYGHSNGKNDTKASYIDSLVSHQTVYVSIDYQQREFIPVASGVVLMRGRALVKVGPPGKPSDVDLNFLAVFREEGGKWRFLAWQSCKNQPATPPTPPSAPVMNMTAK